MNQPWICIFKDKLREGHGGYVISSCTTLWSILSLRKFWGLPAHDHQVVNFFHLVVVLAAEKLGNTNGILLSRSFREELKQEVWGRGSVPGKAPVGSCWVTVVLMICSLGPASFGQSPFTTSTFCFWNQPKNVKNSQPKMWKITKIACSRVNLTKRTDS